jgi:hypothetical protein
MPEFMTLADVTTAEQLAEYQAGKRAWKASLRAQGFDPAKFTPPPRGAARPARAAKR